MSRSPAKPTSTAKPNLTVACVIVGLGVLLSALAWQSLFNHDMASGNVVSPGLRAHWGGVSADEPPAGPLSDAEAPTFSYGPFLLIHLLVAAFVWPLGAAWISRRTGRPWKESLALFGKWGWLWWFVPEAWDLLGLVMFLLGADSLQTFPLVTPQFWIAVAWAGWLATLLHLADFPREVVPNAATDAASARMHRGVWIAFACYVVVFTAMNWQLYWSLQLPHGDSAMYEEHLWNTLHGKGFRSYLDQGLFLGEHIQFIHLGLLPIYWIWPSQLLLELCESLALAAGVFPIYWLTVRHTGSRRCGLLLAIAFLLYAPLQYLDISIDIKTFRPFSFAVPLLLWALYALECKQYGKAFVILLVTLTAKEDVAIPIACIGAWLVFNAAWEAKSVERPFRLSEVVRSKQFLWGIGLAVFGTAYLLLAMQWLIPYFRAGSEVHYTRYFSKFGNSMGEVIETMMLNPSLLFGELFTIQTAVYAVSLLIPVVCLPLLSPARLAVGMPLFFVLCLNEIARDPRHHFHAPLVPIIFWAAAAGLGTLVRYNQRADDAAQNRIRRLLTRCDAAWFARFAALSSLTTGIFLSLSPLGVAFWDPYSHWYWQKLYVPDKRAELLPLVLEQIPINSRVASTDFIHPRFTHYERSYDYSHYLRKVAGYRVGVPEDTDYIVIDTHHRYSDIKSPDEVRELREHPERWELLPDRTDGYYIILKRKRP